MSEIRFSSKEHEKFFYQMLAKCGKHDSYYSSFFYCVGISEDTRNHVDRMFDFKESLIKPEAAVSFSFLTFAKLKFRLRRLCKINKINEDTLALCVAHSGTKVSASIAILG